MNFQQLRSARAAAQCGFNLAEAAQQLQTPQSGISRQIRELEGEIGLKLFKRSGKRLTGLTDFGQRLLPIVTRILEHERQLRDVSGSLLRQANRITIATTPTQARYLLPPAVLGFRRQHAGVELHLQQSTPDQVARQVLEQEADLGLATESLGTHPGLFTVVCAQWSHRVIVPPGHPLADGQPLTLERLQAYPLVVHESGQIGREVHDSIFTTAGAPLQAASEAIDADVIKAYVRKGLGVGVIASIAYDAARDTDLVALDASHLLAPGQARLAVRRGARLHRFLLDFIRQIAPAGLPAEALQPEAAPHRDGDDNNDA